MVGTLSVKEIQPETLKNVASAVNNVNQYFENGKLTPGENFSFLEANNYFSGNEWTTGKDFIWGSGACDVATLLNRAVKEYSNLLGLPYERLRQVNGKQIWGSAIFEVSLVPHDYYQNMPSDEVLVSAPNRDVDSSDSDFTVGLKDKLPSGKPLPGSLTISFRIESDGRGSFRTVVKSNYSIEELRSIIR